MTPPQPPPLAWHRTLEARAASGIVVLVALALAAVLWTTTRTVTSRSLERASEDLAAAHAAFDQLIVDRTAFAAAHTALVAALPVFRAHIVDPRLAEDRETLSEMGEEYRGQLGAAFLIVADRGGRWTASPGWPSGIEPSTSFSAAIGDAAGTGRASRAIVNEARGLFLVVMEPARFADETVGALTVGFPLDDGVARRLAEVTHCEVNLAVDGHVFASSLPPLERNALVERAEVTLSRGEPNATRIERLANGEYVVGVFPFSAGPSRKAGGRLVLLQNWGPTRAFVDQIRTRVLAAGSAVFAIALGAGLLFSRRMSRPLKDLAAASADIASGNWLRQVPEHGSSEAVVMARAFNHMTASLRHWYDQVKKRDDELRQTQKLEALGRLAGGVAHDFNNLLTAIKGYAELVRETLADTDARRADVDEIIGASDRATRLTRQLLTFSRRQPVAPRVLAIDRIVVSTEQMLRRLIGETIAIEMAIDPQIGCVRADATQLDQVLLNLAVNARDAMPKGGTLRIALENIAVQAGDADTPRTLAPGPYVRLSVSDTGCGMTSEIASKIFEPFFTTKEEGRGTGLGLATVYGIVEQCGGAIQVDTKVDRGTTFHIYLPQAEEDALEKDEETGVATTTAGAGTVLLVEDEQRVNALVATALRKSGYTVLEAYHGEQALQILDQHASIDLLLTDVVMPGMNGRELADRVRLTRKDMRVLYMSGYSDDAMLKQGVGHLGVHFLSKPFSMAALNQKVSEAMRAATSGESAPPRAPA